MKIYCLQTIIIPNSSKSSIIFNLDNYKEYDLLYVELNSELVDKNLIILNPIQNSAAKIELKIFNLNPILNSDNPNIFMSNLMRGNNKIKINEGDEICKLINIINK